MRETLLLALLLLACGTAQADSIPLIREHGTFVVPVVINGKITLNFTIDSGATDVSIPADVFSTLVRADTVSKDDFLDMQVYELADGTKQSSQRFRIRSLRIGSLELRDVTASVAPAEGSLLLGQSFLSRIKSWSIDNERHLLVFNEPARFGAELKPTPPTITPERPGATRTRSTSTTVVDHDTMLKAVAFVLANGDLAKVKAVDWAKCVFRVESIPLWHEVDTFYLNNVDPARITIHQESVNIVVDLFGEDVVLDGSLAGFENSMGEKKPPEHYTLTEAHISRKTAEYQRTVRAWKYIYSHGCTGHKSSF
jgi:clan AA aspartic protease (TIGR02281 family)